MNTDSLRTWLKGDKSRRMVGKCLAAGFSFVGGVFIVIMTFGAACVVAWIATYGFCSIVELVSGVKWHVACGWFVMMSGVFVILLFIKAVRMDSWVWGRYARKEWDIDPRLRSDIEMLLPSVQVVKHSGLAAKVIAVVLVTGPRLVLGSFGKVREFFQILKMDVSKCAAALDFILSRTGSVSYEEFCEAGLGEQLKHLRNIEGVQYLKDRLSFSDELKTKLNQLK
jgi:hypothetical protein